MSLEGFDRLRQSVQQNTSTTNLFTVYRPRHRVVDEDERKFVRDLIQVKQDSDELDMASIIQEMNKPEDIFQREERWIQAGGDCLFSEFEKPVLPSDNMPVEAPVWINLFIVGSIFFFMIRFFLFIYP